MVCSAIKRFTLRPAASEPARIARIEKDMMRIKLKTDKLQNTNVGLRKARKIQTEKNWHVKERECYGSR